MELLQTFTLYTYPYYEKFNQKKRYKEGEIVPYGKTMEGFEPEKTEFTFKLIQILDK